MTARKTATAKSRTISKEIAALLPPSTTLSEAGTIEGLPYLRRREIEMLQFIYEFLTRHRHYPTRGEIAKAVMTTDVSGPSSPYLRRLVKIGYLALSPATNRNLRLTAQGLERLAQEGIAVNTQQLTLTTQ